MLHYLRIEYADSFTECAFVIRKSRNAPIKTVSIPRLELQGALLAAKMDSTIRRELDFKFEKVIFWTDSMIVLNYIRNESRRFQTYVANRVTEIRDLTDPYQWRHCAGAINPTDDASRGLEMSDFFRNDHWLKGPSFLHEREEEWPESKFNIVPSDNLELKKEVYTTSIEPATTIEDLVSRSSNWVHTLRRVAWLLKFLDWIKCHVERKKNPRHTADVRKGISQEDLKVAKRKIAILAQKSNYPMEMKSLKEGKPMRASS